ncbi:hypothetical protein B0H16DRAFT_1837254 [Mycena metata]|uniref:Chromo domain-containing protein n=1 Tax=Mycena metata TaxID=1033252 RepID=A0AAD7GPT5_9AGAR|nr:hypothetical protein B0H16DRAFT_1837254 [Mycena metata]
MPTETFYVEKVIEARLDTKGTGRTAKRFWSYCTIWVGFGEDKATWEPAENFDGNKYAITQFWKNADLGPRIQTQLSKFNIGEVITLKPTKPRSKPGPGRSSDGVILGTQVFALWPEDQHYYPAVIQRRSGTNYVVRFDEDGSEITLPLKHMRACSDLRRGDTIILKADEIEVSEVRDDGSIVVEKTADYTSIKISAYEIEHEWSRRQLCPSRIICALKNSRREG